MLAAPCALLDAPIFMDVTLCPHAFKTTPMLLAVTPFPNPLTTPPETRTYFIATQEAQPGPISSVCWSLLTICLLVTASDESAFRTMNICWRFASQRLLFQAITSCVS